jgi:hypothetical protein
MPGLSFLNKKSFHTTNVKVTRENKSLLVCGTKTAHYF